MSHSFWVELPGRLCWGAGAEGKPGGPASPHTSVTSTKPGPLPLTIRETLNVGHLATFVQMSQWLLRQLAGSQKEPTPPARRPQLASRKLPGVTRPLL